MSAGSAGCPPRTVTMGLFVAAAGVCIAALVVGCRPTAQPPKPVPWSMEGANPARTSLSGYRGPSRPKLLWTFDEATLRPQREPGESLTPPVTGGDGTIFIASVTPGRLHALSPRGKVLWTFPKVDRDIIGMNLVGVPPAVGHDGAAYWLTTFYPRRGGQLFFEGVVFAVDPRGKQKWRFLTRTPTDSTDLGAPIVTRDGTVYFCNRVWRARSGTHQCRLFSLGRTGILKWTAPLPGEDLGDVAVGPDGNIIASTSRVSGQNPNGSRDEGAFVSAFSLGGSKKWSTRLPPTLLSGPAVASNGTIYVGAIRHDLRMAASPDKTRGGLLAFSPAGRLKFSRFPTPVESRPAVAADGTIYVSSASWRGKGELLVAFAPDGTIRWTKRLPGPTSTPSIDRDGNLYVPIGDRLVALAADGKQIWQMRLPLPADLARKPGVLSRLTSNTVLGAEGRIYITVGRKLHAIGDR